MSAAIEALAGYRGLALRRAASIAIACALTATFFVIDVATGPALLPLGGVVRAIFVGDGEPMVQAIVWAIRLPIACMAVAVGAALATSGAVMQTILNNPLASCYTLGISAGAGFGAALAIVLGAGLPVAADYAVPVNAFAFSTLSCAAVFLAGRRRDMTPESMVLAGIALLFLFQALQSLLQYIASPETLQQIVFWLFGSLLKATWAKVAVVAAVTAALLPVLLRDSWALTALRLGEDRARGLGIDVKRLRLRALAAVSLLTAVAVCFVGTIGFVGLVAPHLARMLVGEDQRFMLPMSALCGAGLLSAASVASKLIWAGAIFPIGIVTALLGVPFFLWLVLRAQRSYW